MATIHATLRQGKDPIFRIEYIPDVSYQVIYGKSWKHHDFAVLPHNSLWVNTVVPFMDRVIAGKDSVFAVTRPCKAKKAIGR